jgi:hypothetical protein
MLRVLNQYCHGYTFIPVASALEIGGFFELLKDEQSITLEEITSKLDANPGPLFVALEMLTVLDWVCFEGNHYRAGPNWDNHNLIDPEMVELYSISPLALVTTDKGGELLSRWLARVSFGWECEPPLSLLLDAPVMLSMLIGIVQSNQAKGIAANDALTFPAVDAMREVLLRKKWAVMKEDVFQLNGVGKFMIGRAMVCGVTVSYRPLLHSMETILFGNSNELLITHGGTERHIDRILNVQSSGFQHEKYFAEMEKVLRKVFDPERPDEHPCYFADMGCGDGSLLKRLHGVASELGHSTVTMIGIDLNQLALDEAEKTLSNLPRRLMKGNIADPEQLLHDFIDEVNDTPDRILHLRSFLDHNRSYIKPIDSVAVESRQRVFTKNCGIGIDGSLIPYNELQQNLVEHLRRWANIMTNKNGLLCLEVHSMSRSAKAANFELAEGFHFDALHAFSRQFLCEPQFFYAAMAEVGLFPMHGIYRYPKGLPYTRITLDYYERKSYTIRFAHSADISHLEKADWSPIEFVVKEIEKNIEAEPQSCFTVLNENGYIMGLLMCKTGRYNEELKLRNVSMIGLATQSSKWGDRLLRHSREYFSLQEGELVFTDGVPTNSL